MTLCGSGIQNICRWICVVVEGSRITLCKIEGAKSLTIGVVRIYVRNVTINSCDSDLPVNGLTCFNDLNVRPGRVVITHPFLYSDLRDKNVN